MRPSIPLIVLVVFIIGMILWGELRSYKGNTNNSDILYLEGGVYCQQDSVWKKHFFTIRDTVFIHDFLSYVNGAQSRNYGKVLQYRARISLDIYNNDNVCESSFIIYAFSEHGTSVFSRSSCSGFVTGNFISGDLGELFRDYLNAEENVDILP
jgi:hypothetical protein